MDYERFESDKSDNKISQGLKHFQATWQLFQINLPKAKETWFAEIIDEL